LDLYYYLKIVVLNQLHPMFRIVLRNIKYILVEKFLPLKNAVRWSIIISPPYLIIQWLFLNILVKHYHLKYWTKFSWNQ
jgi:hypothetical protein